MVEAARRIARREGSRATFSIGANDDLAPDGRAVDVVAAASLLAVLSDRRAGIRTLWRKVAPRGTLLIVEPTARMTARNADCLIAASRIESGSDVLRLWARGREGQTVDSGIVAELDDVEESEVHPLVDGLVAAWVIRRAAQ